MVRLPRNEKQTHRLNSRLQMGPSDLTLALTLTLNSQGQIWNWLYLCQNGPIATKRKANISFWTLGLKLDNGFDLGHDVDIWIFKVICDLDHLVTKVRCKDLPDSDRGDFSCRRAVDSSSCVLLSGDNSLKPRCLWLLAFVLNNTLILGIWCSTIPHLSGCFYSWTFLQNIGFNMVPSGPFISHLATQFGYSAGEFQALQLIVLAKFGDVD